MSEETGSAGATSTETAQVAESISLPTTSDGKPNFGSRFGKSKQGKPAADKPDAFLKEETELTGKSKKVNAKPIGQPSESKKEKPETGLPAVPVEAAQEAKIEPPKEEVKPPEIRKYKLTIDGEEIEVDEDELKRGYQIRKASDKRFREAAEIDKRNRALLSEIRMPDGSPNVQGVVKFLRAFGLDPDRLAEDSIAARLEWEMLTPEQKRIRELEQKAMTYEQQVKQIQQAKQQQAEQEIAQRHADNLQKSIMTTLDGTDLPKTAETVKRIVRQMKILTEQGVPCEPRDVIDVVREEMSQETKAAVAKMSPEQLLAYLGKEKMDEFRKWELSQIKNPVQAPREPIDTPVRTQGQKKHFKTMDDWKRYQAKDGIR